MATVRQPTSEHRRSVEDSLRWRGFEHRPDDIFISTPPKSGTTWMQGIVSSLLWPAGDAPGDRGDRSPWIDARFAPIDEVLARLDAQQHRRFIKTHSPADCVPIFEECKYVVVYRDGRDALMSWANHRGAMRPEIVEVLNASAAEEGLRPLPEWDGDMDELFDQWSNDCSPITHLASWWPLRHESYAYFVHYNDLKTDLEGEMRRLAAFLGIEVPDGLWPETVARCGLSEMREDARGSGRIDMLFENGADAFFHKGTNGRWRDVLTPAQLDRYDAMVAAGLPADAAHWLESGSLATGSRPSESRQIRDDPRTSDEQMVRLLVEQLITAAGDHDLDTFEAMMAPHANVGWASFRDGAWTTSTTTARAWIAEARSEVDPILYTEPVHDWTVHVDGGHLAFVRADAVVHVEGRPERHNIDYFTLIKQDGVWKFLTVSYVGRPAHHD